MEARTISAKLKKEDGTKMVQYMDHVIKLFLVVDFYFNKINIV